MANHRMISSRVANSAAFLQMPAESQLLFFHMVLRADDDGVVESYPLMKLLGTNPDSFKVLLARGFIRQLNEDQVIVISDWLEHNTIRADRKVDSMYLPTLLNRYPETKIVVAKPRIDVKDNSKRLDGPRTAEVKLSKGNKAAVAALPAPFLPSELREVRQDSEGKENPPKEKKDAGAWALREKLYDIFEDANGVRPTPHSGDYTTSVAALKVLNQDEVVDLLEQALESKKPPRTVREALSARQIDIYRQDNQ